jgi:hypothetical protein
LWSHHRLHGRRLADRSSCGLSTSMQSTALNLRTENPPPPRVVSRVCA